MPSADAGNPIVFQRDTANALEVEVELFGRGGSTSRAMLRAGAVRHSCASRREASLTAIDGKAIPDAWSLALARGVADPFLIGGIEELAQRDSAAVVARISRLVSGIPEDSASAPFRGLPVVVRDAWSFRLGDSTQVFVAIAMRSDNVESNPRAEAMVLVAEPDRSAADGRWRTGFSERMAGPEDRIEGMDLLAAFQVHGARPVVALVREGDGGVELEIVERQAPGVWAVRWSGLSMPCAGP